MSRYVDGFVLPVPKKNLAAYKRIAKIAVKVWRDHGALDYRECIGEDMTPGFGVQFPKLAKAKANEVVMFSWIVYKSRAHRDRVNAKVIRDPRLAMCLDPKKTPFDIKRMACGGFRTLVAM